VFEVITEPSDLPAVRAALEQAGVSVDSAEVVQRPKSRVSVGEEEARRLFRLIDALEESDDVNAVHANFDVAAEVMERVAG
jgi:transcriptional/translational regulatory protein YebC/TACO1